MQESNVFGLCDVLLQHVHFQDLWIACMSGSTYLPRIQPVAFGMCACACGRVREHPGVAVGVGVEVCVWVCVEETLRKRDRERERDNERCPHRESVLLHVLDFTVGKGGSMRVTPSARKTAHPRQRERDAIGQRLSPKTLTSKLLHEVLAGNQPLWSGTQGRHDHRNQKRHSCGLLVNISLP